MYNECHNKIDLGLIKWKYFLIFLHKRKTSVEITIYAGLILI